MSPDLTTPTYMYNYIYNFIWTSLSTPYIQAWYLGYGTKDVFESVCHKLNERIAVELDGKAIELPELEGIVLLNIASWSSGCDLWAGSGLEEVSGKQRLVVFLNDCCFLMPNDHLSY